jgi:hypothetical protein
VGVNLVKTSVALLTMSGEGVILRLWPRVSASGALSLYTVSWAVLVSLTGLTLLLAINRTECSVVWAADVPPR